MSNIAYARFLPTPYSPNSPRSAGRSSRRIVLNEIRAFLSYSGRRYVPHYRRSYDGTEVDILCETAAGFVAVEITASSRWDTHFNRGFRRIRKHLPARAAACYGVYLGERAATWGDVRVLPVPDFLKCLWDGEVMP